ncbi:MAG: methyltransferase domain-containing protein [Bacteroidales bacterium]
MKQLIPERFQQPLKRAFLKVIWYGRTYHCNVCNASIRKWKPIGYDFPVIETYNIIGSGMRDALCPVCSASDRVRLLLHFLQNSTTLFKKPVKLLHIAPEPSLEYILNKVSSIDYLTADLNPEKGMMQLNITATPFPGATFDAILCNHVLEHIPDDLEAMEELYRILKPNGWAILQVPISMNIEKTYEDFSITDERDREKAFGQKDHVRIYGRDYTDRLKKAGFSILQYRWTEDPALQQSKSLLQLNREEVIFFCTK